MAEKYFQDLSPPITYHHLHSHSLGVRDPLRVVALCDSDAFYAACEAVRLGLDGEQPLVVLQWDSLIAVNYPARKFGISRMDKLSDAKKRCPDLVVVHVATYREGDKEPAYWEDIDPRTHKVSLDHYRRESLKIINMLKDSLSGAEVEKASIDEAFIDLTPLVRTIIMERHPYLASVPCDLPDGIHTPLPQPPPISWDGLGVLIPVVSPSPRLQSAIDNKQPENDSVTTWHDVALSIAAELTDKTRTQIYAKLGYTTSVGLARNKFLAKLAASHQKPMNQTIVRNAAIPNFLHPLPFQKIRFLGGKLGAALAKEYDASTVGDLLPIRLEELQVKFGECAFWVHELLRGIDRSSVKEKSALSKSMLASKNLPQPVRIVSEGDHWIRVLAADLALRLGDARKTHRGLWPRSIVLHIRQGYDTTRSKQSAFPYTREMNVDVIAAAGVKLWKELVGGIDASIIPLKITNIQLAFTGLEDSNQGQQTIEGFLKGSVPDLQVLKRSRVDDDDDIAWYAGAGTSKSHASKLHINQSNDCNPSPTSFTCSRCFRCITLSAAAIQAEGDAREAAFAVMKLEHEDFHFAQDLSRATDNKEHDGGMVNLSKDKKRRKEVQGIARFFNPL